MSKNRYPREKDPLVSVLIPTYNRKWLLPRTLNSVLGETYKNLEIILVNDAGEDVQDIVNQINDPRIKYFQNEKNLDLAGSRNVALKQAKGDYICLLDDDDIHLPMTIEFRLNAMESIRQSGGKDVEVVYTRALQDIWRPHKDSNQQGYVSVHKQLYWDSPFDSDLILIQNIAPCCCPFFSRRAFEETGYWFDESLTTSEDWDFWVHMSRKFFFWELKLVDCECTFRESGDSLQMTGNRTGYTDHLPYLYKKWRHFAKNLPWVIEHQNNSVRARGLVPEMLGM